MGKIVGVKYRNKDTGEYGGRTYSYFCTLPVAVGDIVNAPTVNGDSLARICEVDVPEGRIDGRIMPLLKTITSLAEEEEC